MTWGELICKVKAAGFEEQRHGRSHRQFVHPDGRVITVAVHTKKEVATGLARRILKEAGLAMTQYFPIIVEQEENGAFSAWVRGPAGRLCRGGYGGRREARHPKGVGGSP